MTYYPAVTERGDRQLKTFFSADEKIKLMGIAERRRCSLEALLYDAVYVAHLQAEPSEVSEKDD